PGNRRRHRRWDGDRSRRDGLERGRLAVATIPLLVRVLDLLEGVARRRLFRLLLVPALARTQRAAAHHHLDMEELRVIRPHLAPDPVDRMRAVGALDVLLEMA